MKRWIAFKVGDQVTTYARQKASWDGTVVEVIEGEEQPPDDQLLLVYWRSPDRNLHEMRGSELVAVVP